MVSVRRRHDQLPLHPVQPNPQKICAASERAAEEPTGAIAETGALKGPDRWRASRVLCHNGKQPQKRSRPWMRSLAGCEVREIAPPDTADDLVRFVDPRIGKASVRIYPTTKPRNCTHHRAREIQY